MEKRAKYCHVNHRKKHPVYHFQVDPVIPTIPLREHHQNIIKTDHSLILKLSGIHENYVVLIYE